MRRLLSVFMLIARSTIYKIMILLVLMAVSQGILFYTTFQKELFNEDFNLEFLIEQSRISWVFITGFLIMTLILCLTGCEFGSRLRYTLGRLSISERGILIWQGIYNFICYFLIWAIQLFVMLGLCHMYVTMADPELISGQTVFLAFYRSDFLHMLLPLQDVGRWVKQILLILVLGFAAAYVPYRQRKGAIHEG